MTRRLVLFDFDGTLADSFATTLAVGNRMAISYGYPPVTDAKAAQFRELNVRQILRETQIPIRRLPSWIRQIRKELQNEIPVMHPPVGLGEALLTLKEAGTQLGIVTSNSRENVQLFLQKHGWTDWFAAIESGSSLFGKSRLIHRILDRSGFAASQAAYIGDEVRDIEAARRARVASVAVAWGFNSRALLARHHPDHLLDHPAQLPPLFLAD